MNAAQQKNFQSLSRKHLSALRRQGKVERTIDPYAREVSMEPIAALRRVTNSLHVALAADVTRDK